MSIADKFVALFRGVDDLTATLRQVNQDEQNARREREDLVEALPSRADIKELLSVWVDDSADRYRAYVKTGLGQNVLRKARDMRGDIRGAAANNLLRYLSVPSVDIALLALLGPMIKKELLRVIDEVDWPGPEGLTWAERDARVKAIDKRLADLRGIKTELITRARQHGIVIDPVGDAP